MEANNAEGLNMASDNENENCETVADIVAEMRREVGDGTDTYCGKRIVRSIEDDRVRQYCDRIEAAWKREARAIATEHAVLPAVCITKTSGNAAAMCEALLYMLKFDATDDAAMDDGLTDAERIMEYADHIAECQKKARAALSASARNCDAKYADRVEMYGAFKDWCRERGHTMEPMLAYDAFDWLLAPSAQLKGECDGE